MPPSNRPSSFRKKNNMIPNEPKRDSVTYRLRTYLCNQRSYVVYTLVPSHPGYIGIIYWVTNLILFQPGFQWNVKGDFITFPDSYSLHINIRIMTNHGHKFKKDSIIKQVQLVCHPSCHIWILTAQNLFFFPHKREPKVTSYSSKDFTIIARRSVISPYLPHTRFTSRNWAPVSLGMNIN